MRIALFFALTAFLLMPSFAHAGGHYFGLGGSYALESFDTDESNAKLQTYNLTLDFEDTWGVNATLGYKISPLFALEFDLNYLSGFEWTGSSASVRSAREELDITTVILAVKLSPYAGSRVIRPYVIAGPGAISAELQADASIAGITGTGVDNEVNLCAKAGLGIDCYFRKNVSIGLEGSYIMAFGSLDEVRYTNFSLGFLYHF